MLVLCAPRCATKPSNCGDVTALHATFEKTGGACGEFCEMKCDDGFIQCFQGSAGCETPDSVPSKHETIVLNEPGICSSNRAALDIIGDCAAICAVGFSDCNNDASDGCEHSGPCGVDDGGGDASGDASAAGATTLATLGGSPGGIAICGGGIYFVDGSDIRRVDAKTLAPSLVSHSPAAPAGGLACDDALVYWTTPSDADASTPNGFVMSALLQGSAPLELAADVDPTAGVELRDGVVYFMTTSGLATVDTGDAGVAPSFMPATETGAYKPFATGQLGAFAIAGGSIHQRALDASASSVWLDDAGPASALFTNASGAPFAVFHDASVDGDLVYRLMDDAGAPAMIAEPSTLRRAVATTSGADIAIVASADTIYAVSTSVGLATTIATSSAPIADVATDGTYVYFTTSATKSSAGALLRAVIP